MAKSTIGVGVGAGPMSGVIPASGAIAITSGSKQIKISAPAAAVLAVKMSWDGGVTFQTVVNSAWPGPCTDFSGNPCNPGFVLGLASSQGLGTPTHVQVPPTASTVFSSKH